MGAGVGVFHCRGGIAFGRDQGGAKSSLQGQLLLGTLRCIRQRLEHLEPPTEMHDCLHMCRALHRSLTGQLPVNDGRFHEPRFGVVLRHQLRLRGYCLGKLRLQHLGHLLVHLLAGALEQRRTGRILDQSMFEAIGGTRRPAPLIE